MTPDRALFFGDIHNHNALGYGLGSLERSIDIARSHLDFFAFTGHSSWHDMHEMEGGREKHWLAGFEKLREAWPRVQELNASANNAGEFVSFLGFEWHSSRFGDHCVILPGESAPLITPDTVTALREYTIAHAGLMIPHHLAYATGHRGVNWDVFEEVCSPVVEIYSEHGNSEDDAGPFPYFNHSMGGRVSRNTARAALDRGLRFGFVASSDNHRGFPGAYGEGLLGVWADELTRASIMEGIRARRTIALTGDRIAIVFEVDGSPMGSTVRSSGEVQADVIVNARDEIDSVDLVVDGAVHLQLGQDDVAASRRDDGTFQVRFEYGWGPWGDLSLDRVCDWEFDIGVRRGRIEAAFPCLQSGPFDEQRRHSVRVKDPHMLRVRSYTGRRGAYRQNPNQAVVLQLRGGQDTVFDLHLRQPAEAVRSVTAAELSESSAAGFTGPFPAESYLWHRLVREGSTMLSATEQIQLSPGNHYLYPRVRQRNGQMAWASPVFVEVAP